MSGWIYWAVFASAGVVVVAVPLVDWLERRADARDRETWERLWR